MQVAISRPSQGKDGAIALFEAARRHGFEAVQAKGGQYEDTDLDAERFGQTYGSLADLVRGGFVLYPGGDTQTWADFLQPRFAFAAKIGAKHMCLCASLSRSDDAEAAARGVAETLERIGRAAKEQGLEISMHNHANTLLESEEDLARLTSHLDPSFCGLAFDTAHAAKGGIADLGAAIKRFAPFTTNVHLKDLADDGSFCPLGKGTLDLGAAVEALKDSNYDGLLVVDEETKGLDADEACRLAAEYLRAKGIMK